MDGWVTIGTELDNEQLEKDLKAAEKDLVKFQKQQEKLLKEKGKIETDNKSLEKELSEYDKLIAKSREYKNKIKELEIEKSKMMSDNPELAVTPDTPELGALKQQIADVNNELNTTEAKILEQEPTVDKIAQKYESQKIKIDEINKRLENNKYNQELIGNEVNNINTKLKDTKINSSDINTELNSTSSKTSEIITKIAKWALAVFSIQSAYALLSKASGTLTQYNEQYAADLQYIQYVIAQTLAPILQYIVKLTFTLLSYVNYLSQAWFGVNLFANASAKSFESASNSLSNASNEAKELQKATAGFDKANILSDTSSNDTSSSTNNYVAPSIDLGGFEDVEIPGWLQKFAELGKPIIEFFEKIIEKYGPVKGAILIVVGALGGFLILKSIINLITSLGKAATGISANFTGFLDGLGKAAQAIAILGGVALVLSQVTDLITAFSESGLTLGEVAALLGIILGELALAFTAMAAATKLMDWQGIAGAAVILAGFALVLSQVTALITAFSESGMSLNEVIGLMATVLISIVALMGSVALIGPSMTAGLAPFLVVVAGISAILGVIALTLPTILDAAGKFISTTAPAISEVLTVIGDLIQVIIQQLGESLPPIIESVGDLFTKIFNGISGIINSVGNVIVKILDSVKNLISTTLSSLLNFINKLGPAVENFTNSAINSATRLINFLISGIEYLVNTLIIGGVNQIIKAVNSLSQYVGITIPTVSQVYIPRFTPRLATGAIINNPGKGVPVAGGRAIAGEAGMEGILPLTDSQAMEILGKEIGKWVVINLQNITKLDGRTISRQLSKLSKEKSFARNGG